MGHAFLSDGWFEEVERLSEGANVAVPEALQDLVINIEVTGAPGGDVAAKMAGGRFERGSEDGAPTKLVIPYDVARKLIVERDQAAVMQAFMAGEIQVEGDMSKLMAMQAGSQSSEEQRKLAEQILQMTD